jgi:hypothetical protein
MMFLAWHLRDELKKSKLDVSYSQLVLGNILLIVGSWMIGFSVSRFDHIGLAILFPGVVILGWGIVLDVISGNRVIRSLNKASEKLVEVTEEFERKIDVIVSKDYGLSRSNTLQDRVEKLEKDVRQLYNLNRSRSSHPV